MIKKLTLTFFLLFPLILIAETTGNLLPQQFFNNNQGHGGWNCNDPSHNHGNSTVAAVHGDFIENTVTLGDTLNQSEINGGWTSTLGADIWGWNAYDQGIKMSQTITDSSGTVTTQIRDVVIPGCSGYNCSSYETYTDSYTQGLNSQNDYTIKARFDFTESSQSTSHRAVDLKNPILTIEHSLISVSQVAQLKTMSETVYNVIEDIDTIEYIPEEFNFETFYEPTIEFTMLEEINFEPIAVEEINTGIIDVFMETITYDKPETIESFSTEIKVTQEVFEVQREDIAFEQEIFQERETDIQTSDLGGIIEPEPIREEVGDRNQEENITEEITGVGDEPTSRPSEERIVRESESEPTSEQNKTVGRQSENEESTVAENSEGSRENSEESQQDPIRAESNSSEQNASVSRVVDEPVQVDIEDIKKDIANKFQEIDKQLVATSIVVANIMSKSVSLDSYSNINQDIFKNQQTIDGGNLNEYTERNYRDDRSIYSKVQIQNNLSLFQYQTKVQETVDERIRAEQHLRRIRGY